MQDTNPKTAFGRAKVGLSCVPLNVLLDIALGLQEGAVKYGRHNYRDGALDASVYFDAAIRHLFAWWEGEDIDPDSRLSHITKALTTLIVLRDIEHSGRMIDDRPPRIGISEVMKYSAERVAYINEHVSSPTGEPIPPFTEKPLDRQD